MEKRIGMHSGYFRGTYLENDVFKIVHIVHEAGGNAVEFMPGQLFSLSQKQRTQFRTLLEDLDMELIVGAGRSTSTDPSSPDPSVRAAAFSFAKEVMELLFQLGCHKWDGLIHACWPGRPSGTLTMEEKSCTLFRSAESMRRILHFADQYDVDLCFEVVNRFEHYLLNTAEEALIFCEMINHPRARILLDTFHMNIEENDICDAIRSVCLAGRLGHFHVGEANRSIPGTVPSHLDWEGIFAALQDSGYHGTIILEPFVISGTSYSSNVSLWRDLTYGCSFSKYLENINTGITFIQKLWS